MSTSVRRLALAGIVGALFPALLLANPIVNFQGILVDAQSDTIVADGDYDFDFSIYDQPAGGSLAWQESHPNVPVQDGIYSVNLGATNSLEVLDFQSSSYWLEISVDGTVFPARHQITYNIASMWAAKSTLADTALVAKSFNIPSAGVNDSQIDWGTSAGQVSGADMPLVDEFQHSAATNVQDVLDDIDAAIPTVIGDITDVSTPVGGGLAGGQMSGSVSLSIAADGVNETHVNWGTSTDQISGVDVPLVDEFQHSAATNVQDVLDDIDSAIPTIPGDITEVSTPAGGGLTGGQVSGSVSLSIAADGVNETHVNWGTAANQISGADVPLVDNFQHSSAMNIQNVLDDIDAAIPMAIGDVTDVIQGSGINVTQPQGPQPTVSLDPAFALTGTDASMQGTAAPLLDMQNTAALASGDNLWLQSTATNALSGTWVLYSKTYKGSSAVFEKTTDDNEFALEVYSPTNTVTGEAIYAWGRGDATAGWFDVALGATGQIRRLSAVYNSNEEQMIFFTGTAALASGRTHIAFDASVRDVIDANKPLRVFFTPKNGWSGLYVESSDAAGFNVVTGAGDQQISFDWFAIAPLKERPISREAMMSPEERAKVQQLSGGR